MNKKRKPRITEMDKVIGERLRLFRIRMGMSQQQLGKLTGVTFQQIQKYEKGINRVSVEKLLVLCESLDMEPSEFLKGLTTEKMGLDKAPARDVLLLSRALSKIPQEKRLVFEKMLRYLLKYLE